MPIVKLTSIKDAKLGSKAAKEIVGEKVGTNEEWKKSFFANQKELRDQLENFEVGDYVNVVMEQTSDGKYWNIKEFKDVSDDDIEKATKYAKGPKSGGYSGKGSSDSFRRSDGGSRGDDTNRSAAIYLSREIVNMTKGHEGMTPEQCACLCADIAEHYVYPYIKEGVVPVEEV